MRTLAIISFVIFSFSISAEDNFEHLWVELGVGPQGVAINLKAVDDDFNWAIEGATYTDPVYTSYQDRDTGNTFDFNVVTLGVTKNWSAIRRWGYLDAGIGLGAGKGTWAEDCGDSVSTFLHTTEICDSTSTIKLGIPLHASVVFGKYLGIGLTANAFITNDVKSWNVMLTVPLGDFTN